MAGLPGRAPPPSIQKPSRKGAAQTSTADADEWKIEELSFDEIRALEQEFIELTQGKAKQNLEAVRKKREEDELLGREVKQEEKTDLSEIETAFTGKKGGLPEFLEKLPPEHPLRARFEQGYRRRPDGTWFRSTPDIEGRVHAKEAPFKKAAMFWIPVLLVLVTMLASLKVYNKALESRRAEVLEIIKKKGYPLTDPIVHGKYKLILVTNWLPDLDRLLGEIRRIPRSFAAFPDNPEQGSYIDYIRRHDLPFDETDAQEWYTKNIRKPAWNKDN